MGSHELTPIVLIHALPVPLRAYACTHSGLRIVFKRGNGTVLLKNIQDEQIIILGSERCQKRK